MTTCKILNLDFDLEKFNVDRFEIKLKKYDEKRKMIQMGKNEITSLAICTDENRQKYIFNINGMAEKLINWSGSRAADNVLFKPMNNNKRTRSANGQGFTTGV